MTERSANPFMKSTPAIDAAMKNAKSPADLREALDALLAQNGVYSRGQRGTFDNTSDEEVRSHQTPPSVSLPAASSGGFEFEREVRFAESTGKRTLVIRAHTLEDLNALEKQVVGEI
jgi:hypothetical protein